MNRRITIEAWEALPDDLKRYYIRDGNEYVIEDDDTWEVLFILYLLGLRLNGRNALPDFTFNDDLARIRIQELSQERAVLLRKDFRRALDTKDAGLVLKWFNSRGVVLKRQFRAVFRAASVLGDSDIGKWKGVWEKLKSIEDNVVRKQLSYWDSMVDQTAKGEIPNPGRIGMYGRAAYVAFTVGLAVRAALDGRSQERRVLGAAEHCRDCVRYADQGWQEVGTLPEIGDSICKSNCRCFYEYR